MPHEYSSFPMLGYRVSWDDIYDAVLSDYDIDLEGGDENMFTWEHKNYKGKEIWCPHFLGSAPKELIGLMIYRLGTSNDAYIGEPIADGSDYGYDSLWVFDDSEMGRIKRRTLKILKKLKVPSNSPFGFWSPVF